MSASLVAALTLLPLTLAQTGVTSPLTYQCHPSSAVLCVNHYGAVLPYHFFREPPSDGTPVPYGATQVPSDPSFSAVANASFLIFNADEALPVLGANPTHEFMFHVSPAVHEAPVYVPSRNWLLMSQLTPPAGYLPQLLVDLNQEPPTLSEYLSDPPVYAPNGGTFHRGLVYWGASGGNNSIGGTEQRPGIRTLDPATNKTVSLLNNYFGYYFNTVDDLIVDSKGDVWFTDPDYSWFNRLTDTAPQFKTATYRFRPSTGAVSIVEDTLVQPNGIAISPDGKNMYISDTGAVTGVIDPRLTQFPGSPMNATGPRTVYKYDVIDDGTNIANKRPIYLAQDWVPDGLKVAANGWVLTGAGSGVDVLDEYGTLLMRVQTNYTVQNFAWTGPNLTELWIMGNNGVSRVRWNLAGVDLNN